MFEYVASGISPNRHNVIGYPGALDLFKKINTLGDQKFSFLYNAYQEKGHGSFFKELKDAGYIYAVHADSGGLQMIMRNVNPNATMRQQIYENQAEFSDIAMSFDEIPLIIESADGTAKISDLNTRFFDMENLVSKARESGQNLKDQVQYFNKVKTQSSALMILQGNCLDTYKIWTDELMDVLGEDNYESVGGLALAPTSIGMGLYEDCVRAIALKTNPYNKNKVHLLGIGSAYRMLPFVIMNSCDWFGKNYHISYDSTSHSRGLWGILDYKMSDQILRCTGQNPKNRAIVYENLIEMMDIKCSYETFDIWCDAQCAVGHWKRLIDGTPLQLEMFSYLCSAFLLGTVANFMKQLENMTHNVDHINIPELPMLKTMEEVKTHADGIRWLKDHKGFLFSKPVPKTTERLASLAEYFTGELT